MGVKRRKKKEKEKRRQDNFEGRESEKNRAGGARNKRVRFGDAGQTMRSRRDAECVKKSTVLKEYIMISGDSKSAVDDTPRKQTHRVVQHSRNTHVTLLDHVNASLRSRVCQSERNAESLLRDDKTSYVCLSVCHRHVVLDVAISR